MTKALFFFLMMTTPLAGVGQMDTLPVPPERKGGSYLSGVLIDPSSNLGIFEIHYAKGRLSNAFYYVIDLKERTILSVIERKNWTYLYSSWIDRDSIVHLSKGGIWNRKVLYDLKSGNKVASNSRQKKEQAPDSSDDWYIDSQELYCTRDLVYWKELRISYRGDLNCFIVDKE